MSNASSNIGRLLVAIVGICGFGLLMALRDSVSGTLQRSAVAALAFALGAACLMWLLKPRSAKSGP
ncbi:hypothetical protein [Nannocystis punicea]|uniref:Uncharacterized protein n=1 Tax=Nannocystis punicea TaxID=2995304 RepID=A0ABY7HBE5_9BACT|nr:hypothetical protein [Nannocystis poenicansa]WAS96577.1 hypothetical protein O0S08_10500 [Nannocystis poenicansa]